MENSLFDFLSGLYSDHNSENNYAAYEIRLQVNNNEVILSWDNYDYGFEATKTIIKKEEIPNWVQKLLEENEFIWASECAPDSGFCNEAGVYKNGEYILCEVD